MSCYIATGSMVTGIVTHPVDTIQELVSPSTNPKIDFQVIYFSMKRKLAAQYGYHTEPSQVRQPKTPRQDARNLWALYKVTYKSMNSYLKALDNLARDPAAVTRRTWNVQGGGIEQVLAGNSVQLSFDEANKFWSALAVISIQLNAVQGVPTDQDLLREAARDALNHLPNFSRILALVKWGTIAFAGLWAYGQFKTSSKGKRR